MEVILVGEHTYGKNVGSFTITDEKKRWNYGLQPISFKIRFIPYIFGMLSISKPVFFKPSK